jgi:Alpha-kinase family/von Willebrand factor type A domain
MASKNDGTHLDALLSGLHGRERRVERSIEKVDLQRARRYGMKEFSRRGRLKYTYGGIVFIYDPKREMEITSFPSNDMASETSGTKVSVPKTLPKNKAYTEKKYILQHEVRRQNLKSDLHSWASHSVFVVDMSGSMRRDDVCGGKCRSDAVWLVLAQEFVKTRLDNPKYSENDVVSIVLMRDTAEVIHKFEPLDWILYNQLIDLREWTNSKPTGPGNYLPALEAAETLLAFNESGNCALSLLFFSDGKPSDHGPFAERVGIIASKYRRRLTVSCIGISKPDDENFETLRQMAEEAEAFGAKGVFNQPSLDSLSLSSAVSFASSSLEDSRNEISDIRTGKMRLVRTDFRSERKGTADDLAPTADWHLYGIQRTSHFERVEIWSFDKDSFVLLKDPRCQFCRSLPLGESLTWCVECNVTGICNDCTAKAKFHTNSELCYKRMQQYKDGRILDRVIPSYRVAMKELVFGEGAERIVHKFRYLDEKGNFIGPKMVAKQSRFVDSSGTFDYDRTRAFHATFLRTQALASRLAEKFNKALDTVCGSSPNQFPKIHFVEPMVLKLRRDNEQICILIEQFLEGDYQKFNNNKGYVLDPLRDMASNEGVQNTQAYQNADLGIIEEGSSDDESDLDDDYEHDFENKVVDSQKSIPHVGKIPNDMFLQAFSHFTFQDSKGRWMVVDLQGVHEEKRGSASRYLLTDPAIHRRNRSRNEERYKFGRTNLGTKGMQAFFESHVCNDACRLLDLSEINFKQQWREYFERKSVNDRNYN